MNNDLYANKTCEKKQVPDIENQLTDWSSIIENNVKEIGEKSKGYKIMHIKQSRKIGATYKYLTYTGIVLGPLAGLLSGIGAILNPDNGPVELPIAATCVAFLSGIVVAIIKMGKYEEIKAHHKLAASKYTSLESNVRRQLDLPRTGRTNPVKYLEWVGSSFDDLFSTSPLVAEKIYNDYAAIAEKSGIAIPDEYGLHINMNQVKLNKLNEMKNVSAIGINTNQSSSSKSLSRIARDIVAIKIETPDLTKRQLEKSPTIPKRTLETPDLTKRQLENSPTIPKRTLETPDLTKRQLENSPTIPKRQQKLDKSMINKIIKGPVSKHRIEYTDDSHTYNSYKRYSKDSCNEDNALKGNTEMVRDYITHFPELNKFSDRAMEYEMKRMMGLK